ncbi:VOC family protein [Rhizobium herbae]|uniref:Enzyme related to lactoylglutathione lyase n=1 Tax=Rhizobium herbae TaxID=508661 RepID=A0ABS4EUP2_9HYPH|nr:VOC family protein [Rhizobium herbae]MBP1861648.1 putative enzyme related to lactoylglutathione lyase [Rhizobium herbae]
MPSDQKTHSTIGHFDIAGEDVQTLAGFYQAMFGWDVTPRGPGYAQVETPGLRGALVEAPDPGLTLGIVVPDLDAALGRATVEGGTVTMAAMDNGWIRKGQVRDPAGNLLTLIQG